MRKWNTANTRIIPYLYLITVFSLTYLGIIYWPGFGFSARYLGWGLGVLLPVILVPSFFKQRYFISFIVYAFVVFLNYLAGDSYFSYFRKVVEGFVTIFIPLGMTYYAVRFNNKDWMRAVFRIAMLVIVWVTIATVFFDIQTPGVVRFIHTELQNNNADISDYKDYYALGLSNYTLPHALPAIIPIFAISLRQHKIRFKHKILPITLLSCVMMILYFSGAIGPLLLGFCIMVLSLWVKPGKSRSAITSLVVLGLITLPFLFNDSLILTFLQVIDDILGQEGYFHAKIVSFQESILMDNASGDLGIRQDLYWADLKAFFDNVLIGSHAEGGHSVIFSRLGSLGLLGFIPYVMILFGQAKMAVKLIPSQYRFFYYLGNFAAFLMILAKGIVCWEVYFCWFTLLPLGIVFFADRNEKLQKNYSQ